MGDRPLLRLQDSNNKTCAPCGHSWTEHVKQENGAYACVHCGCGCKDVMR